MYETSGNYFDGLGIQPYLGRFFHESDEHGPNGSPYVVLSYAYWRSHFQGDSGVVGRTVRLNKFPFTVLGVAPPQFRGTELLLAPELWVPILQQGQIEGRSSLEARAARGMFIVGRVKAVVSPAQLAGDLALMAGQLAKAYPKEDAGISFTVTRPGLLGDMLGGPVRAFVTGLMLLAALILLAVCANVGSLFASRVADRSKEIALRLALGSGRKRIFRQLLTEALLTSFLGGAVGLAAGAALLRLLSAWNPIPDMPINVPVHPDFRTYSLSLLLALLCALVFGTFPVRQVLQADAYQVIKSGTAIGNIRKFNLRDIMLAAQIAICAVLVTASLVAVQGLVRSVRSHFGFVPQNAMLVTTDLAMAGYNNQQAPVMQRRMLAAVQAIPGVTAAAYADRLPLGVNSNSAAVFPESASNLSMANAIAQPSVFAVSPGYFEAAGTTLLAGRSFDWHDDQHAPRVAVVNQEFARAIFGSTAKAVGAYFKTFGGVRVQVVGVAEDGRYKTLAEQPRPAMFLANAQGAGAETCLIVRSTRDPRQIAAALDRSLHRLDPGMPLAIDSWYQQLDSALFASRAATVALGVLGVIGAALAVTGVFGMASYSVSKRLRELGIRVALGASRKAVLGVALGRASRLLALGSVVGLALGLATTRLL